MIFTKSGSKRFFILAYALGLALGAYAQSVAEIKSDKNYVWGEGVGVTTEEAEQAALAQMSRRISVSVFNQTEESDDNGSHNQRALQKTTSSARLQNVQTRILSDEPEARVFCYLSKAEVEKMFRQREERITDLVESGKKAEQRLQIDDALRSYYWALLLANTHPTPVNVEIGGHKGLASSVLRDKIKSVLLLLKAEVAEGEMAGGRINTRLRFTYDGKPVSSLQVRYNDGQSMVGPVSVRDGMMEAELVSYPGSGKLRLGYELRFKSEAMIDADLASIFNAGSLPPFNAMTEAPFKMKGNEVKAPKPEKTAAVAEAAPIPAETTREKTPIEMRKAATADAEALYQAVLDVEQAIRSGNPQAAFRHFTPDGYRLFSALLKETGTVSLVGKSGYEFVESDGYLTGRATHIKIKFSNGKTFMENLVYRFEPQTGKIASVAFALTKQAENDIMNAATSWPEESRWTILRFMEDYQTAFALKRLDYISSIFSDDALIITGAMLSVAPKDMQDQIFNETKLLEMPDAPKSVRYSRLNKQEYLDRLKAIFAKSEYVHLTFEDNRSARLSLPSIVKDGAMFGIEIKQRYASPTYSDDGYLTLVLDTRGQVPLIHVRLWQPDKAEVTLQKFLSNFTK